MLWHVRTVAKSTRAPHDFMVGFTSQVAAETPAVPIAPRPYTLECRHVQAIGGSSSQATSPGQAEIPRHAGSLLRKQLQQLQSPPGCRRATARSGSSSRPRVQKQPTSCRAGQAALQQGNEDLPASLSRRAALASSCRAQDACGSATRPRPATFALLELLLVERSACRDLPLSRPCSLAWKIPPILERACMSTVYAPRRWQRWCSGDLGS